VVEGRRDSLGVERLDRLDGFLERLACDEAVCDVVECRDGREDASRPLSLRQEEEEALHHRGGIIH
jgi:hypothetical protein